MLVEILIFDKKMKQMKESECEDKSDNRGNEEGLSSIKDFRPRDCHPMWIEVVHREGNSEDRTDKCMGAWSRDSEIPRSEIPYNRSDEERKDNTDSKRNRLTRDHIERKEVDNPHRHSDASEEYSTEVKKCSKENGHFWWKGIGIDNGSNRIGCIMESIDKLKSTDEDETENEEDKHSHIDSKHKEKLDDLIIISYLHTKSQNIRRKIFDSIIFSIYLEWYT